MIRRTLVGIAALGAGLLLAAAPARAADQEVTFQVPVKVEKLHPEVTRVAVACRVTPTNAYGTAEVNIANGAYTGTVAVKVKVTQGESATAQGYRCELFLYPPQGSGWKAGSAVPQGQAKAGTEFVPAVEGTLPVVRGAPLLKALPR